MGEGDDHRAAFPTGRRHGNHRGPSSRRGSLQMLGKVLAAALSGALLLGFGYGWYEYRSLNSGLHRLHLHNLGQPPATAAGGPQHEGQAQNIVIAGVDSRADLSPAERRLLRVGGDASLGADTIMVIHVPADGSRATMISIPRDSFVDIPGGYLKNKINASYADGYTYGAPAGSTDEQRQAAGADVLVGAVQKLTGLQIDHYVQVGFGGFYTIAKAIGGIRVNLCQAADDTHAYNRAHGEGSVGSDFKMSAGWHDLTPVQSLEFVRQRHNLKGDDLGREKRQRYFLTEAFSKITSAGVLLHPAKLNKLIKAVTGAFYVDDNGFSLVDLANQMADLSADRIAGYTIPVEGAARKTVANETLSVELVDPVKVRAFIGRVLEHPTASRSASGSSPAGSTGSTGSTGSAGSAGSPAGSSAGSAAHSPTKGCVY